MVVAPSTSKVMPRPYLYRLPLTWLGAYITLDGSAKRRHASMAYTRSRSERRLRRATSAVTAFPGVGKALRDSGDVVLRGGVYI